MITVFTPTYNRKEKLHNLYLSLLNQFNCDFEWLIVDDGSTDGTKEFIEDIRTNSKIDINYYYKNNGGKQSAYNFALDKMKGDIFLCIDSDDIFNDDVLKIISKDFENLDNNIAGIMYLQGNINVKDKIIGSEFPQNGFIDTYYNIYNIHKVSGDKLIVLKSDVAKEYYFPIMENEKFIPEALIFNRISKDYKFKCFNKIMAFKEYLDDGYSNNYFNLVKKNPNGNLLYFKELYDFKKSFYNVYGYILFSIYASKRFKDIINNHSAKLKIIFMYLPILVISKIKK